MTAQAPKPALRKGGLKAQMRRVSEKRKAALERATKPKREPKSLR